MARPSPVPSILDPVLAGRLPTGESVTIGLIGRGIGASLTPLMHEREGARLGLDYRYHLIDFDRLGLDDVDLAAVLEDVRRLGFAGVNVTYPFKQAIMPLLNEIAPDAQAIGAVNTVVVRSGRAVGHNTDSWGFAQSFAHGLPDVERANVLQLGAGGAGAAVAHALLKSGVGHLALFDTLPQRAQGLAANLRTQFDADVSVVESTTRAARLADGIVNTTPVGMTKLPGLPIASDALEARHWIADVIYFPLETEFIALARARGCRVLSGAGMAVHQAVRALELFTGLAADAEAMDASFRAAVTAR
jgi:shikimate dehydrogenase